MIKKEEDLSLDGDAFNIQKNILEVMYNITNYEEINNMNYRGTLLSHLESCANILKIISESKLT
jgi:hypothetical protein